MLEATNKTTPLQEEFFNPLFYLDYLSNEHYHHSEKGCNVVMERRESARYQDKVYIYVNKICLTHNKTCSKTGWELGWYQGTCTDDLMDRKEKCQKCGDIFVRRNTKQLYCTKCAYKIKIDYNKKNYYLFQKLKRKYEGCGKHGG